MGGDDNCRRVPWRGTDMAEHFWYKLETSVVAAAFRSLRLRLSSSRVNESGVALDPDRRRVQGRISIPWQKLDFKLQA
jgi:hypothetical protein